MIKISDLNQDLNRPTLLRHHTRGVVNATTGDC